MPVHFGKFDAKVPLVFSNGTEIYNKLAKEYITHKKGFFILAPSGSGKTYFVEHQKEKNWLDGDTLWVAAGAHPDALWWLWGIEATDEIDQQSDVITMQAKKLGFWIVGASNNWLKPDAIVLPHWSTHKKYIIDREKNNYDGGAKSDRLNQLLISRKWTRRWIKKGVPEFKSVAEAAEYLIKKYSSRD